VDFGIAWWGVPLRLLVVVKILHVCSLVDKVETPIHDNDLILAPIIAPQSG
jgi:hypothetical protein